MIAGAANYPEVEGAERRNDFIHKLGIVRKELNESLVWLRLLSKRQILPSDKVMPLIQECDELGRIISASKKQGIVFRYEFRYLISDI